MDEKSSRKPFKQTAIAQSSIPDPEPYVFGLLDPDPDPYIKKQKTKKTLDFYCFVTSL
jgi:hypothetical protein